MPATPVSGEPLNRHPYFAWILVRRALVEDRHVDAHLGGKAGASSILPALLCIAGDEGALSLSDKDGDLSFPGSLESTQLRVVKR